MINVLIVLDGGYRFDIPTPGDPSASGAVPDFTYVTLVNTLTAAGMNVTKAHRSLDMHATPGFQNFDFTAHDLNQFDCMWLIGLEGVSVFNPGSPGTSGALSDPQITAIANFMDAGGGVFATGDHYSLGAVMSGKVPRVRAMRSWYGAEDTAGAHMPASFPRNFPPLTTARADTTRSNPGSNYSEFPPPFIWFENQSDALPQTINPDSSPAHPILRKGGADILVYPDHMHEGTTQGVVPGYNYSANATHGDTTKPEFRTIAGHQELPRVIATGQNQGIQSRQAANPSGQFSFGGLGLVGADAIAELKQVNTLCVYDGRVAGVGRIVTGATFHHYVDINLTGDSGITSTPFAGTMVSPLSRTGPQSQKGHGFNDDAAVFDQIKQVYRNITTWLARPKPSIQLILERSSFSKDEALAAPANTFGGVVLVTVDGLRPSQFPGGALTAGLSVAQIQARAPQITVAGSGQVHIEATAVSTDDNFANDRLQRITFTYQVRFSNVNATFNPIASFEHVQIDATLTNPAAFPAPLTDRAWLTLIQGANPFMLDLDGGNQTTWLSSDIKVFRVRQGNGLPAVPGVPGLPGSPVRSDALSFIRNITSNITAAQFESLTGDQQASTLSSMPLTTGGERVFNFAVARVRLNNAMASANDVRVFFRMFTSQTTAALTYRESAPGVPIEGYVQTAGANPIALPGKDAGGTDWLSFPFFSSVRAATPGGQTDADNVQAIPPGQSDTFFGVLLDNNLADPYLGLNPGAPSQPTIRDLLTGEHQCLVAQIEYNGAPIPNGATPWTSDKLSQRNLAVSTVANPGLDASRVAMHTFEIEATPGPITAELRPDELLLDWSEHTPPGTVLRIHMPSWRAQEVVDLADRYYSRHEIEVVDDHTIELPAGGTRYVPIPISLHRQTGVIAAEFPLGIRKGQRFDVSVRQVTTRHRRAKVPPPQIERITLQEAARMIKELPGTAAEKARAGQFDLGDNKLLLTDLSLLDMPSDHALIIENPEPAVVEAAVRDSGRWRETIGAFQLGVPVSTKDDMRLDHMRLLSVMRWRLAHLPRTSRWRKTMAYYVALLTEKVQALGANPWEVPATSDGAIPQLPWVDGDSGGGGTGGSGGTGNPLEDLIKQLAYPWGCLVLVVLLVIIIWLIAMN
ncbi:MAG: hypothetical protein ACKOPM_10270 [Novosphingobium sp.]